ncbi:GNAT family N-acetyltransferase [uncultured Jatrophihabitans sp.]|uniref:GNAT family N-acetyltransferase n=1 Tax=uncultured Jatrophihabitans sp. TaxID=1610747 RepID=UPI0035C9593E
MSSLLRHADGAPARHVFALRDADRPALLELLDEDPFVNAVLASRVHALPTFEPRRFGGELLGVRDDAGGLAGAAFLGGNLLPVGGDIAAWRALARSFARRPRPCSSFVGRADAIGVLWDELAPAWGPERAVRARQLLLTLDSSAAARLPVGDERLHIVRRGELDVYLPAAVAMFTEELGISPLTGRRGDYRARVAGLVGERRALAVTDRLGVVFKADIGAVTPQTCQVQGVWVRPDARGRGIGTAAMTAVLRHGLTLAPSVSLYVNDFNDVAVRMYATLGMRHVADLATVLF